MKKSFLFVIVILITTVSCRYIGGKRVRGSGVVKTEGRNVGNFKGVASHGSYDVYVSSGPISVRVEGDDNLLPYIETRVDGGTLNIDTRQGYWLSSNAEIKVYVSAPDFSSIQSYGSGNIISQSKITGASQLKLGITGSADIVMEVDAPEIIAVIDGSGNIKLKGETKAFTGKVLGSGNVRAMELKAEDGTIRIMGSGDAELFATNTLDVDVTGSGSVRYKGEAKTNSSIAGSGSLTHVQ